MVQIDRNRCNRCEQLSEGPRCVAICPGDLFYKDAENEIQVHDYSECWDCCACVKECPRAALSIQLPFQINESRTSLCARHIEKGTVWYIRSAEGTCLKRIRCQSLAAHVPTEKGSPQRPLEGPAET